MDQTLGTKENPAPFDGTVVFRRKGGVVIVTKEIVTIKRKDGVTRDFPNKAEELKGAEAFIGHRL